MDVFKTMKETFAASGALERKKILNILKFDIR